MAWRACMLMQASLVLNAVHKPVQVVLVAWHLGVQEHCADLGAGAVGRDS